jgi:hypothetical protein
LDPAVLLVDGLHSPQTYPDLRPQAANNTTAQFVDTSKRQPTAQHFNLNVQRQLAANLILTVSYNDNRGRNQMVWNGIVNPNAIPLSALQYRDKLNDLAFNQAQRPYPQYQDFEVNGMYPAGRFLNKVWNFQVEKRTSGGLALTAYYQYFRRWDDFSTNVQDYFHRNSAWARSTWVSPHQVSFNYIYELPMGPGKPFFNSGPLSRQLFGGWALSGTTNINSGSPLRMQPLFNNTGGVIGQGNLNVDVVPGVDPRVASRSPLLWFNPAAYGQPADFTAGNGPRVDPAILGPKWYNHDLTLNKRFVVAHERTIEFTASMFNATNHANLNDPDTRIGSPDNPNSNAGRIIGSYGGRIVQLGLRFNF